MNKMKTKQENDIRIKKVMYHIGKEMSKLTEESSNFILSVIPKSNGIDLQFYYGNQESLNFIHHLQNTIRIQNNTWFDSGFYTGEPIVEWNIDYFDEDLEMSK